MALVFDCNFKNDKTKTKKSNGELHFSGKILFFIRVYLGNGEKEIRTQTYHRCALSFFGPVSLASFRSSWTLANPLDCVMMASIHFSCLASIHCCCSLDYSMGSRPSYCPHLIASAAMPIQSCPYLAYDGGSDAAISSAYHRQRNCMDRRVAAVVLVSTAT